MLNGINLGERKDKQYSKKEEMLPDLQDRINKTIDSPKFMIAAWRVTDENMVEYVGKFCWQFPNADFLTAVAMLTGDMQSTLEEMNSAPAPLPPAPFLENLKGPDQTEEVAEVSEINEEKK